MIDPPPAWIVPAAFLGWAAVAGALRLERLADAKAGRVGSIEGLRGVLALMVVAHHFAVARQFAATGRWELTPSPVWNLLGQGAVALFFMITGFLFAWTARLSPGPIDAAGFVSRRAYRLYPAYLATVGLIGLIGIATGGISRPAGLPSWSAAWDTVAWLAFSAGPLLGWPDASRAIANVPWSLQYEWFFYLALPAAAATWRAASFRAWPALALLGVTLLAAQFPATVPWLHLSTLFLAPFAIGACATLVPADGRVAEHLRGWPGAALVALGLGATFVTQSTAYGVGGYLLLGLAFVPIALGNDLRGVLTLGPLRLLGAISYDVYLLQGVVLYLAFEVLWPGASVGAGPLGLAGQLLAVGLAAIAAAIALHRWVEVPGERLRRRAGAPRRRAAEPPSGAPVDEPGVRVGERQQPVAALRP